MIQISWITKEEVKTQPEKHQDIEYLMESGLEYDVCDSGEYFIPTHTEQVSAADFYERIASLVKADIPIDQILITTPSGTNSLRNLTKYPPIPGSVIRYNPIDFRGTCDYLGEVLPADNEEIKKTLSPEAEDIFFWFLAGCYVTEDDICFNTKQLLGSETNTFSAVPANQSTVAGTNFKKDIFEESCITSKKCLHPISGDQFINTFGARLLYINDESSLETIKNLPQNAEAEEVSLLYYGYDVYDKNGALTGVITFAQNGNMRSIPLNDRELYFPRYYRSINQLIKDKLTEEDAERYEDIYSSNEFLTQFCMKIPHWLDIYNADYVAETSQFTDLFLRLAESYYELSTEDARYNKAFFQIINVGEYTKTWIDPIWQKVFEKEKDYITELSETAYQTLQGESIMLCAARF